MFSSPSLKTEAKHAPASSLAGLWVLGQLFPPPGRSGQSGSHFPFGHLSVLTELKVATLGQTPGGGFHPVYEEHLVAWVPLPSTHSAPLYIVGSGKSVHPI
jgi:hypothetical protein